MKSYEYMNGFGNHFSSEALPDSLPKMQNSPQICNYGLYAEQLSGTSFTAPRNKNQRTWLYRIRPSVCHEKFFKVNHPSFDIHISSFEMDPNQKRWNPIPFVDSSQSVDFVDGLLRILGAGDESCKKGVCIYNYTCNISMNNKSFQNSDGDFLIVPQSGKLIITTEMGIIQAEPREIVVIQRGIKFSVHIEEPSRGYILESLSGHFELPTLGPIGSNGLANPRDFETPVASFVDNDESFTILNKFMGNLYQSSISYSPYNVVAWHGK